MDQNATVLGEGLYRLDRDALAALAQNLCRQLTERGAYHGGIRPDNIGCDEQGNVFLGEDVGGDANREWTPAELEYMAPEVFWNGTRNPSADVYSIGMLLYAGVTGGQLPFTPKDPSPNDQAEALRRRMNGEALPIPKTAGKHLGAVIEKATQFRADDRYESPAALDAVLEETREAIRNYIPPAREMLNKPVQELTEMERLLLAVLTEKAEAEEATKAEAGQGENPYLKDLLAEEDTPEEAPKEPPVEPTPEQAVMEKVAEENRLDSVLLINAIAYIAGMAGCPLTRSKAQIILYCLYGAHLAAGERLPMEHPQVWKYGPVFPRAYKRGDLEDRAACEAAYGELLQRAPALLVEISTRTQAMMGTPMADLNAVHKGERSPYGKTRARYPEKWGMPIPDEEIAEFFRKKTSG